MRFFAKQLIKCDTLSVFNQFILVVCKFGLNKCYYSCQQSQNERHREFDAILKHEIFAACPRSTRQSSVKILGVDEELKEFQSLTNVEEEFLSNGLWLTTIIFMGFSSVFALVTCFFSMLNIFWRPFRTLSSPFGLYIWNGIAAIFCILTMIFWMSLHLIFITKNVAITDTLTAIGRYSSVGLASLGFSFWILIIPVLCHVANICLIYYRSFKLQHEPKPSVVELNKHDQPDFY